MDSLQAISPIDGRYRNEVEPLGEYFSEYALIRCRLRVEIRYFIALANHPGVDFIRPLTSLEVNFLRGLIRDFDPEQARRVKEIEARLRHDVKAVEVFLREQFAGTSLEDVREGIHFGLTSEDVNNLAHALAVRDGLAEVYFPVLEQLQTKLREMALAHAAIPMLARTHGQPASPTTVGKEFAVFAGRIEQQRRYLQEAWERIPGKLNGATGGYNAHLAAYPDVDWIAFSRDFITSMGLAPTLVTTQIEPHDALIALFDALARINAVLLDLCQDMWHYISYGYFAQVVRPGEVSSSTMPHKVNPIHFENAEGNLEVANALFQLFARRLPVSRMQRDLSNSTVMRNIGVALAHTLIACKGVLRGLDRLVVDEASLRADLDRHWEVITEGIQTILRREHVEGAYDILKAFSRGVAIRREDIVTFVAGLDVSPAVKDELLRLTPETYIGESARLAGEQL